MTGRDVAKRGAIALVLMVALASALAFGAAWGADASAPDPTEPISAAWVGWGVNYLCAKDGYQLHSWLSYGWDLALVPIGAQLMRNLRKWWPGLDGVKVLQWAALHFINAQPAGTSNTIAQSKP